ncbi:MAG: hypothetical protein COB36_14840 [Alphaproteobacteria bacterium]|nr:MAG: hypothetical protein COB36_14840 [Alphaproteobacteria bacterium]
MNIKVTGTDGQVFNFPEGTSQDVMRSAMQKHYGVPNQPQQKTPPALVTDDREARITQLRQERGDEFVNEMLANQGQPVDIEDNKEARHLKNINRVVGTANAAMRFSNSATLGLPKRIMSTGAGLVNLVQGEEANFSGEHEKLNQTFEDVREQFPKSSMAADIGGAVVGLNKVASAGGTAMRFVPKMATGGKRLAATTAALAVDGAAIMGAEALIDGQNSLNAAGEGGVAGAAFNIATKGAGRALMPILSKVNNSTTTEQLKRFSKIAYKRLDNLGVKYTPEAASTLKQGISDDLNVPNIGLDKVTHPHTWRIIKWMGKAEGDLPFHTLNQFRKKASRVANNPTGGEDAYAASILVKNIDDFIDAAPPAIGNGQDGKVVTSAVKEARALYRKYKASQTVEGVVEKAKRRASSGGSGSNTDNAVRQNIRQILDNPKRANYFSKTEKAAMEKVVNGAKGQNLLRLLGKAAPTGIVSMGGSSAIGGMLAGPQGALGMMALGMGAKSVSDRITQRNVKHLLHLIQTGKTLSLSKAPSAVGRIVGDEDNQEKVARVGLATLIGAN